MSLLAARNLSGVASRSFARSAYASFRFPPHLKPNVAFATTPRRSVPLLVKATGLGLAGLGLGFLCAPPKVYCDGRSPPQYHRPPAQIAKPEDDSDLPPPPASSVSLYQLSFGTVTGICAGIFIKKGAKAVAWLLGGVFILLQYLNSASLVRVDWRTVGSRFENVFYTADAQGIRQPPTFASIWTWLVDFLTADFQPRASFLAGLALGLRIG